MTIKIYFILDHKSGFFFKLPVKSSNNFDQEPASHFEIQRWGVGEKRTNQDKDLDIVGDKVSLKTELNACLGKRVPRIGQNRE